MKKQVYKVGQTVYDLIDIKTARTIFADLDKIILSGYPYKRFHPRKYNMLKKKYL